jgi:hypothetical protein
LYFLRYNDAAAVSTSEITYDEQPKSGVAEISLNNDRMMD